MRPSAFALALVLLGSLACRKTTAPTEPEAETSPTSEPSVFSEAPPADNRSATPVQLCEHAMSVMQRELGEVFSTMSDDDRTKFLAECIDGMNRELEELGAEEFHKQATCVLAGTSFAEMEQCDHVKRDQYESICKHVMAIVRRESNVAPTAEVDPEFLSECVSSLEKERATMTDEEYERQRTCIFRATNFAELELCDKA